MIRNGTRRTGHGHVDSANDEHHGDELHDAGLSADLGLFTRRRASLTLLGTGLAALVGCSGPEADSGAGAGPTSTGSGATSASGGSISTGSGGEATAAADAGSCEVIPEETAGPYPGDGSNGPDVLSESGVVRQDIRSSFGASSTTADGVPVELVLRIVDTKNGCAPLAGAAVYAWHCDAEGRYSMYSDGVEDENFLRGVQESDADGYVRFTSIFPGCYSGRWPHVHFEVYPSVDDAASASNRLRTSQMAFPEDISTEIYGDSRYPSSARNLSQISLDRDMVFRDGVSLQMAAMTGEVASGLTATLTAPV
ncbi:MAG: intradiol ring-cleavage dioxygenase [Microthrixaceae bacterium]